jgi:hypothetical protein
MTSSFLIRIGLVLIPVALIPFSLLFSVMFGTAGYVTGITSFIAGSIPVLFAVAASMTEPNNSRSWQIVSTVIVFFFLKFALNMFAPDIQDKDMISAFTSAIITATFSSHITANTLHLKRYLQSRFLNFGILLICSAVAVTLIYCIHAVLIKLYSGHESSNLIMNFPVFIRVFLSTATYQFFAPFGAGDVAMDYIAADPDLNYITNIKDRLFIFQYGCIALFIPVMLTALYLRIGANRRLPVIFLIFIAAVTSFFPHKEYFVLLTILWLWPGLFTFHIVLSSVLMILCLYLPEIAISSTGSDSMSIINPLALIGTDNNSNIAFLLTGAGCYFFLTLYLLSYVKVSSLTWKIKKRKSVRIRLISDRKDSKDLSLLAIRTMKMAGGIDNLKWVKNTRNLLKIAFLDIDKVNVDAVKGMGIDSRIDSSEKVIYIYAGSAGTAEKIANKIIIFAQREFSDLTKYQEVEKNAMDSN